MRRGIRPWSDTDATTAIDINSYGMAPHQRHAVAAIAELFEANGDRGCGPRVVSLCGAAGTGKTTVVAELARVARLNGFVPVSGRLIGVGSVAALLRGRTLFLIDDDAGGGWTALLSASLVSARPHVMVIAGREDIPRVDVVSLAGPVFRSAAASDRRLAAKWRVTASKAAEQAVVYGGEELTATESAPQPSEWPAPGELVALGRRVGAARQLLESGRHAPGERMLRQAMGALMRRSAWSHAVEGALALAASMLKRGRARRAVEAL